MLSLFRAKKLRARKREPRSSDHGSLFKKSEKAIDPVCLMKVNKDTAKFKTSYKSETYYFCSEGCREEFRKDPEKYL